MTFDGTALYAALIHELKNNLGLLAMTVERIPMQGEPLHDQTVDEARMLCQGVVARLQQALLVYKSIDQPVHPAIDAYSPHDLVRDIQQRALALSHGRFQVDVAVSPQVPALWFLDRELTEMALINAIQNSLVYAQARIAIEAALLDGCLALTVRDDSGGYPQHILDSVANHTPYRATGTGLGLQFARLIALSHENRGRTGALQLYNDHGAVFRLLLP